MDKQELIAKWNKGELSPGELVSAFSEELAAHLGPRGIAFSEEIVLRLESSLLRRRRPDNFSLARFLAFAERVMHAGFADVPDVPTYLVGGDRQNRYLQRLLNDLTVSGEEEQEGYEIEEEDISSPKMKQDISFSSMGFSPIQQVEDSRFQEGLGLGNSVNQLMALVDKLHANDSHLARFAALRLFGGLTLPEISTRTGETIAKVRREWGRLKLEIESLADNPTSPLIVLPADDGLLRMLCSQPELMRTLDWRSFEKVLATVLERIGFEIELQKGTKDGGIDIFALRADPTLGAHRYLIQAKRWSHKVGVEPVRELLFLHSQFRATKSCLATTASFSRGAWRLAAEYRWQLELRDLAGLRDWLDLALNADSPGADFKSPNQPPAPDCWRNR